MSERRDLSLRLNDVLDMVGASEEIRRFHQQTAITLEQLHSLYRHRRFGKPLRCYQCGSSFEGTFTTDLVSDIDVILCYTDRRVIPHRLMAGPGLFLQIVKEDWTRQGYVKLQLTMHGQPITIDDIELTPDTLNKVGFDRGGKACLKPSNSEIAHGPANMYVDERGRHYLDFVNAVQCKGIPRCATEWITRRRRYDWPPQQLIDELKMMGCLFVGVGHFKSPDKDLEWRLSLSLQERQLMKSLNSVQHKVYILLKMTKKNVLEKWFNEETMSSYHCKTCVFYMVESTPSSLWVPENLITCLLQCLQLLLRWIRDRFCPSFFLKDANLFDKEGFVRVIDPLERLIHLLQQTGHQFLYLLQSDRVGDMLRGGDLNIYRAVSEFNTDSHVQLNKDRVMYLAILLGRHVYRRTHPHQDLLSLYMADLEDILGKYSRTTKRCVLPWINLSVGLEFAIRAIACQDKHEGKELMKKFDFHMQQAKNTDLVNIRLAQASILLRLEKLEDCSLLLHELEDCCTYRIRTLCSCPRGTTDFCSDPLFSNEQQARLTYSKWRAMSVSKLMKTTIASCVMFERSQMDIVPLSLRYEMYRSMCTRPGSRCEMYDDWFDRAMVDAKVYLYLLQYLVYSRLNKETHKRLAMENLASITMHDIHNQMHHRETAFNLLGWIYLQEHRIADAMWCFLQSWQIRPHHNAAKFHVLVESFRIANTHLRSQNST